MSTVKDRTAVLEELAQSFRAVTAAVRRLKGRETQRPGELSHAQYGLLFGLARGGEMSAGELAIAADVSPATVTQMLEALEAAGLVKRTRSEQDKRVVFTSLTEDGQARVDGRGSPPPPPRARYEPLWRAALDEFSEEELATAAAVLDRLHDLFDELAA
jgi:DNA-binding MarR family transcriptional regulator